MTQKSWRDDPEKYALFRLQRLEPKQALVINGIHVQCRIDFADKCRLYALTYPDGSQKVIGIARRMQAQEKRRQTINAVMVALGYSLQIAAPRKREYDQYAVQRDADYMPVGRYTGRLNL